MSAIGLEGAALRHRLSVSSCCVGISRLELSCSRHFHASKCQRLATATITSSSSSNSRSSQPDRSRIAGENLSSKPQQTPMQKAEAAAKQAREKMKLQEEKVRANIKMGGLAPNGVFGDDEMIAAPKMPAELRKEKEDDLSRRDTSNMARVLNPRPNARARWQRRMVIRHVRRGGRLTKEMKIARTERKHLAKSHFFKTSMKKLAPLARQIAGKSVDEAILQMRFSKKKVAQEVREHLIQARNEAVAIKGMGIKPGASLNDALPSGPVILDPSITPLGHDQRPSKTRKPGSGANDTDIYIAEAWTNSGPYGRIPEFRARGRINILRPPHTGVSVLLKEERTRNREKAEKQMRAVKRRLGKSSWTQLPDRKVTNQSQYVLW